MELTEDTWRALARSTPWRWQSIHFTRVNEEGSVEAWLRRPGELLVREENGRETYRSEPTRSSAVALTAVVADGSGADSSEARLSPSSLSSRSARTACSDHDEARGTSTTT